jgi:hypothetical protein
VCDVAGEIKINEAKTGKTLVSNHVPYGAILNVKNGQKITKGESLCTWDPYNAVILSEAEGKIEFEAIEENNTYKEEADEQTGKIVSAVQKATTEVREAFEAELNIFDGGGFDLYIPTDSTVPVSTRRAIIAVSATFVAVPVASRRAR